MLGSKAVADRQQPAAGLLAEGAADEVVGRDAAGNHAAAMKEDDTRQTAPLAADDGA